MATLYIVTRRYLDSDSDSYYHYEGRTDMTYHLSREGAERKVQEYVDEEVAKVIRQSKEPRNSHVTDWDKYIEQARNNQIYIFEGVWSRDGEGGQYLEEYFVREVELLD